MYNITSTLIMGLADAVGKMKANMAFVEGTLFTSPVTHTYKHRHRHTHAHIKCVPAIGKHNSG